MQFKIHDPQYCPDAIPPDIAKSSKAVEIGLHTNVILQEIMVTGKGKACVDLLNTAEQHKNAS